MDCFKLLEEPTNRKFSVSIVTYSLQSFKATQSLSHLVLWAMLISLFAVFIPITYTVLQYVNKISNVKLTIPDSLRRVLAWVRMS